VLALIAYQAAAKNEVCEWIVEEIVIPDIVVDIPDIEPVVVPIVDYTVDVGDLCTAKAPGASKDWFDIELEIKSLREKVTDKEN
jgi:hypothetical protein